MFELEEKFPFHFPKYKDSFLPPILFVRWDNEKGAENICIQLGYTGGTKYNAPGGTGPILAGNRLCSGGEKTVFDCPLQGGRNDSYHCIHDHDQGVHCINEGGKELIRIAFAVASLPPLTYYSLPWS